MSIKRWGNASGVLRSHFVFFPDRGRLLWKGRGFGFGEWRDARFYRCVS